MGMDVFGNNSDTYFRASVWQWPPIHCLIKEANERFRLGIRKKTLMKMEFNSGAGLSSQEKCDRLAAALSRLLEETQCETFTLDSEIRGIEKAVLENLGSIRVEGWKLEGQMIYSTSREHVEEFIQFLRVCGGFSVW